QLPLRRLACLHDAHIRAEAPTQTILDVTDFRRRRAAGGAAGLALLRTTLEAYPLLNVADRHAVRDDLAGEVRHFVRLAEAEEGTCVTDGERTVPHEAAHGRRQREQAQRVRHGRSILAD